jgi:hypothetical protein
MRLTEFVKRSSLSDWCLVAFTFILTAIAYLQWHMARVEERAWVLACGRDCFEGGGVSQNLLVDRIQSGQPITYQLFVKNVGKTPAKSVTVDLYLVLIPSAGIPPLTLMDNPEGHPHERLTSAVLFPGAILKPLVPVISLDGSRLYATDDQVTALRNGSVYLASFGVITYDDTFGDRHTTRFCSWNSANPSDDGSRFNLRGCDQANGGD